MNLKTIFTFELSRLTFHAFGKLFQNPMRRFFTAHISRLTFVACLFLTACENDEAAIEEWTKKAVMVEEGKNIETYFSQNGILKAILRAPLMIRAQDDTVYTEFPKTLHVDFYDSLAVRESWLDARYGNYYESLNKVLLRDSVIVINTKGDTLSTQELWWDQNAKKFYTDKPVSYKSITRNIHGSEGMEASQDLTDVTFRQSSGRVLVEDKF